MQASQSNSASNHLLSESKPDSPTTRFFPSPFSAPIQAARKYLERQRGEPTQFLSVDPEAYDPGSSRRLGEVQGGGPARRDQSGRDQASRDQASRDRDRRLERSLYEGHSIEAGLNFAGVLSDDFAGDFETGRGGDRAYLADSDGTEPFFPYAIAGPLPDPEAVRGAISRLARESELRQELRASEPDPSPDFGEVARRVWGAKIDLAGIAGPATLENKLKNFTTGDETATGYVTAPSDKTAIGGEACAPPDQEAVETKLRIDADPETAACGEDETGINKRERDDLKPQPAVQAMPGSLSGHGLQEAAPEVITAGERLKASSVADLDVESEPALAHDACNLLSALALYSELLASPGVLGEDHRCYAEEMRLLAGRSHVLIDRLLRGAARRPAQASPPGAEAASFAEPSSRDTIPVHAEANDTLPDSRDLSDLSSKAAGLEPVAWTAPEQIRREAIHGRSAQPETESLPVEVLRVTPGTSPAQRPLSPATHDAANGATAATNMADLLMRWGSLLSTLAHGTLEVVFGANATTPVAVEAEALERILVNLVRNARAATIRGGAIRISVGMLHSGSEAKQQEEPFGLDTVGATPPRMVLTVDDSGCGMTEAQIRRILREDEEVNVPQATAVPVAGARQGLGLQIVRQLVTASGGMLSIQSVPGRGTRIEVGWPVTAASSARTTAESRSQLVEDVCKPGFMGDPADAGTTSSMERQDPQLRPAPVPDPVSELVSALVPGPVSASVIGPEVQKDGRGPDGFNETELRAMILRLHRGGSPERSPLSRRLGNRPGGLREAARGLGATHSSVARNLANGSEPNDSAHNDRALKGAIAC